MFITFEGGEGCGKSTHAKMLKDYFELFQKEVVLTKEPGGFKNNLRKILLDNDQSLEALSEIFLFAADRVEHVEKIIKPALSAGKIVISDRYIDSTIAYQLGGRGLPEDMVRYINWISSRGLLPDITFLLDIKIEEGLQRTVERGVMNRFEKEIMAFHERVKEKYMDIASKNPQRIKVIDTYRSIDEVQREIRGFLKI
ncbi:MAG: tmk [Candidatus Saganbacteria bacterium]|uniref:Thymidylate kinase n=1 Tax=Candidatus Saganbacteria bacterium TaxID=2575572 RepID=A0A833NZ94_UNCSA|nr:MAG: tmk [Candidatus Saganbacteria bacterium]